MNLLEEIKKRYKFLVGPVRKLVILRMIIFFCVGIVVSITLGIETSFFLAVISVFSLIMINSCNKKIFMCFLFFLFGVLRSALFMNLPNVSTLNGRELTFRARIVREVEEKENTLKMTIKPLEILSPNIGLKTLRGKVLAKGISYEEYRYGDIVEINGVLENPGEFDGFSYEQYLKAKGIYSILKFDQVKKIDRAGEVFVKIKELKSSITSKIERILPKPHSLLFAGIIYGGKANLGEEFSAKLSLTGTTHIIAVSGYNITVLISSFGVLASIIGRRKSLIFSLIFIIGFMFFVGVDNIPVVRATFMGISLMISQLVGRKRGIIVLLPFTIAILLLLNPLVFKLISFQLSFLSTLGLIVLADVIEKKLTFIPEFTREDVASTFAALFFTMPVTLFNFNEFSTIAPIANFLILPVVPFITIGGFLTIIIIQLTTFLGKIFVIPFWLVLEYMILVINLLSRFTFAKVGLSEEFSSLASGLLYIVLVLVCFETLFKKSKKYS